MEGNSEQLTRAGRAWAGNKEIFQILTIKESIKMASEDNTSKNINIPNVVEPEPEKLVSKDFHRFSISEIRLVLSVTFNIL